MNIVEPIRDQAILEKMLRDLRSQSERNFMIFMTGIYTGLRISDILKLKVADVQGRSQISINETKTGKKIIIEINKALQKEFKSFCHKRAAQEYLFLSRNGVNRPVTRNMFYKIINKCGEKYKLRNIGTHTMRKTFGYHYYRKTNNIALLQRIFNHFDPLDTLRYIGITQDEINNARRDFNYDFKI